MKLFGFIRFTAAVQANCALGTTLKALAEDSCRISYRPLPCLRATGLPACELRGPASHTLSTKAGGPAASSPGAEDDAPRWAIKNRNYMRRILKRKQESEDNHQRRIQQTAAKRQLKVEERKARWEMRRKFREENEAFARARLGAAAQEQTP